MKLSVGIVGLPNVGKSTLFNALTKNKVDASNYPFCTIDPNVGVVEVPDERLAKLAEIIPTQKIVPAIIEFVDIAGIIKGASEGEGLGNKFLSNIKECQAIAEVVRVFTDKNVAHVAGAIDLVSDIETIKTELILADIETVSKRVHKLEKEAKSDPKQKNILEIAQKIQKNLDMGKAVRELDLDKKEQEDIADMNLLTQKPHLYIFNVGEENLSDKQFMKKIAEKSDLKDSDYIFISAKIEADLNELTTDEKNEYLSEIGQTESGLSQLVNICYDLLGLQTYFTAGEKEIKSWTIEKGWTAPQAAGVIHTDFEKGFIKAETVSWEELYKNKGWLGAKSAGKVRLEGRDYVVADGDVMVFKFNV